MKCTLRRLVYLCPWHLAPLPKLHTLALFLTLREIHAAFTRIFAFQGSERCKYAFFCLIDLFVESIAFHKSWLPFLATRGASLVGASGTRVSPLSLLPSFGIPFSWKIYVFAFPVSW